MAERGGAGLSDRRATTGEARREGCWWERGEKDELEDDDGRDVSSKEEEQS